FFLYCSAAHRLLPSFPTRRSSDLFADDVLVVKREAEGVRIDRTEGGHHVGFGEVERLLLLVVRFEPLTRRQPEVVRFVSPRGHQDRKSTRLNSSHLGISYAVFCLK